uniref:Uncharacterized protein n=1 Tax=viral metagenome TaxID=1070528 RepID=A0A6C0KLF4_9ZZZZ
MTFCFLLLDVGISTGGLGVSILGAAPNHWSKVIKD